MAINITYAKAAERIAAQRQTFIDDMENLFKQIDELTRPEEKTGLQRMIEKIQEGLNKNYAAEDLLSEFNTAAKEEKENKDVTNLENIQNIDRDITGVYSAAPVVERYGGYIPRAQEGYSVGMPGAIEAGLGPLAQPVGPLESGQGLQNCPPGHTPILDANGTPTGGCRKLSLQELNTQYEAQDPNQITAPRSGGTTQTEDYDQPPCPEGYVRIASGGVTKCVIHANRQEELMKLNKEVREAQIKRSEEQQQPQGPGPGGPTTAQTESQREQEREEFNRNLEEQIAAGDCVCERTSDGTPYNPGVNRCVKWSPGCSPGTEEEEEIESDLVARDTSDLGPPPPPPPSIEGETDYERIFKEKGDVQIQAAKTEEEKKRLLDQQARLNKYKQHAYMAGRLAAQSAGDMWNIKKGLEGPDLTSYSRLNFDPITGRETKMQIEEQGATSRESLKQVAGATGAQAYLSGLSNIDKGVSTAISQVDEQLGNLNQQGKLSVDQYNSRVEILEEVANAQAKAKSDELLASGITGLGENISGSMDDAYKYGLLKDIFPATDPSTFGPSSKQKSQIVNANDPNSLAGLSYENWKKMVPDGTEEDYKKWRKEKGYPEVARLGGTVRNDRVVGRYKRRIKNSFN